MNPDNHIVANLLGDLKEYIGLQINQRRPKELGEKSQKAEELVSLSSGEQTSELNRIGKNKENWRETIARIY